jgi:hypothetical protein
LEDFNGPETELKALVSTVHLANFIKMYLKDEQIQSFLRKEASQSPKPVTVDPVALANSIDLIPTDSSLHEWLKAYDQRLVCHSTFHGLDSKKNCCSYLSFFR